MRVKKAVAVLAILIPAIALALVAGSIKRLINKQIMSALPDGVAVESLDARLSGTIIAKGLRVQRTVNAEPLNFRAEEVRVQVGRLSLLKQFLLTRRRSKSPSVGGPTKAVDPGSPVSGGFRHDYDAFARIYAEAMAFPWRRIEISRGRLTAGVPEAESMLILPISLTADKNSRGLAVTELTVDRVIFGQKLIRPPLENLRASAKLSENSIVLEGFSLSSGRSMLRLAGKLSDAKSLTGDLSLESKVGAEIVKAFAGREVLFSSGLTTAAKL
ncbi:MAG: hypothetical protein HY801_12120, partial [Candidatus Lindowbacteria bacterium]|nr:hypothetical protein [Candidatus Lindowbacteria bacterium]